jgi:hypothetical protein
MNQILETALHSYVSPTRNNWATLLDPFALAYNNTPHSATGFAPSFLLYGFHPHMSSNLLHLPTKQITRPVPLDLESVLVGSKPISTPVKDTLIVESSKAASFLDNFEAYRSQARESLQFAHVTQRRNYNKGRLTFEFDSGDLVLLNPHSLNLLHAESGRGKKLLMKYDRPFEITQKISPTTYRLRLPASYGIHPVLNLVHLEPYTPSDPSFRSRPIKHLDRTDFSELPEFEVERILAERWCKAWNQQHVQELLVCVGMH